MATTESGIAQQNGTWQLLLADDHAMLLEALADRLQQLDGLLTVIQARDYAEAVSKLTETPSVSMALLDYHMPGMQGAASIKLLRKKFPALPIGVISGYVSQEEAEALIAAGAIGVFPKKMSGNALLMALKLAMTGQTYMPWGNDLTPRAEQPVDSHSPEVKPGPDLTDRQREVLNYVIAGAGNKEIAQQLDLSEITVKVHVAALCRKFAVSNRTQLAMAATRPSSK